MTTIPTVSVHVARMSARIAPGAPCRTRRTIVVYNDPEPEDMAWPHARSR
jgi:hypothetical protein